MKSYDHKRIERTWQERWTEQKLYETKDTVSGPAAAKAPAGKKENLYTLVELPYTSGDLHIGHLYAFAVPDIYVRMKRMQGKNVLYPIGFDTFGLPAENAAIKNKADPAKWTKENIDRMRAQLHTIGNSFDWSREVATCDPSYYKWTQWLFLKLYEKGLAYRGRALVNWDPVDKTVLANEQVLPDGTAERSGEKVEKKELEQWFLKITAYADRLAKDLDNLDWPNSIKEAQRNWIVRSEGAEIDFPLIFSNNKKYTFVILHGFRSWPFFPRWRWLKKELEKNGHSVIIPRLPHTYFPSEEAQVSAALNAASYDENTVLVGHSLGAVVALKVLEKLKSPIARLVTIGGFIDTYFKDTQRNFEKRFSWEFDGAAIKRNARSITVLHDPRDHAISELQAESLAKLLGVQVTRGVSNEPHFTGATEPDVLMWLRPTIRVFTTRPDTLFGGTYLVLAPENPWVTLAIDDKHDVLLNKSEVAEYVTKAKARPEIERTAEGKEKTGVELKGVTAINPATKKEIPIWVADFVLGHYGTGAVFADAHDQRDFDFAKKYNILLKATLKPADESDDSKIRALEECFEGKGILYDSGEFSGLTSDEAIPKMTKKFGRKKTTYKLRDWLISRQRYWGPPIPIVYDPEGKPHPIPEEHLPWLLPTDVDFTPTGVAPLARSKELLARTEKIFGKGWKPEADTMDVFVDSSWYFLRYLDPKNSTEFSSLEKQKAWMPVQRYSGGGEHTTVHVLYSRFFQKALYALGLVTESEPYKVRMNRGIILAEDGRKMSKRWGNVVNPDLQVANVGADAVRTYLAFIGPYNEVGSFPWNTNGLVGVRRFLERVAGLSEHVSDADIPHELVVLMNQTVKKVGDDIEAMKFNTSVSH